MVYNNPLKVARLDVELHLHRVQNLSYRNEESERVLYWGTNKCCVFNQSNENPFGNWSKECIIDRDLLGP